MRKCMVMKLNYKTGELEDNYNAIFLAWSTDWQETGFGNTVGQSPVAIVEKQDGTVKIEPAYFIRFSGWEHPKL